MVRKRKGRIKVTPSSGNVFADIGLPEPEEELAKAQLITHIEHTIRRRRLTRANAAALMRIDQTTVSALVNGRLQDFSSGRLMRMLTQLGHNVDVTVKKAARGRKRGRLRVVYEARE